MSETDRSDWLTQRYAVLRYPMNLEHCITPTKRIVLAALKETSRAAEFIPPDMRGDVDVIEAVLEHNDTPASRFLVWSRRDYLDKDRRWFANDYYVYWSIASNKWTDEDWEICFKSRLPGGRHPQLQALLREHYNHDTTVPARHFFMPHVFYSL